MKVLLVTDSARFAGTERHILDLATSLKSEGAQVDVVCPPGAKMAEFAKAGEVSIVPLESRGWKFLAGILRLRRSLKMGHWDLLHAHNGRSTLLCALAMLGLKSGRLITTQHFVSPARLKRSGLLASLANRIHYWVEGQVDLVVAISQAVAEGITQRGGPAAERVRLVHNGIPDPQPGVRSTPESIRSAFGCTPETPLIVCASRLEPEKCVSTLLEACAILLAQVPAARCLIVGAGAQESMLRKMIVDLQIAHAVQLVGFQDDPYSFMGAGDVFVLPAEAEPFGLVVIEAMAMGKPVVATAAGGPLEIITQGETGLLVPSHDPTALAEALRILLLNPDKSRSMGLEGRRAYEQRFTAERMAKLTLEVYTEACHGPGEQPVPST